MIKVLSITLELINSKLLKILARGIARKVPSSQIVPNFDSLVCGIASSPILSPLLRSIPVLIIASHRNKIKDLSTIESIIPENVLVVLSYLYVLEDYVQLLAGR